MLRVTCWESTSIFLTLKSTPIVARKSVWNFYSQQRISRLVLPTPLSPTIKNFRTSGFLSIQQSDVGIIPGNFIISNSMKKNFSLAQIPTTSSFAHKYGITMKQNGSLGSLGLNPNVNIEDEYIQNLLKQIHFMNMEIKLVKQKQAQSQGNALWGIVNRTNQPMVSNIVESSQKYQEMKRNTDSTLYKLERDIAMLQNDQVALMNELHFLEKKKAEIQDKSKAWETNCVSKHTALKEKIQNGATKLKSILQQLQKQKKKHQQLIESTNKMVSQNEGEKAKAQKENLQIKNDEIIEQMVQRDITAQIAILKLMHANLIKVFEEDLEYLHAQEDNKSLKEKVAKVQKDIAGANFQLMQLNQSIKMAESEREKEIIERKKLTEDYENKKKMLAEITALNTVRKQKEVLARKKDSFDIMKAEEQTTKLEKNLEQIKKKLLRSQEANCHISNQVTNYEREINEVKGGKKALLEKLAIIKAQNIKYDSEMTGIKNQLFVMEDHYDKALKQETNVSLDLFDIQRELQYLKGRKQQLTKNIQIKDVLNGLDIQDLQRVVQKNNDLNSTVSTLMTKWDEIKSFSRI